jgi:hypothetical protein
LRLLRALPFARARHRAFLRTSLRNPRTGTSVATAPAGVLILGVYLADRPNSAAQLCESFGSACPYEVEQRWVGVNGISADARLAAVTVIGNARPQPKFSLINKLLRPTDIDAFDFVIVCDDDIYVQKNFLTAFVAYQSGFDFALAQPARAWHSHFDHAFVLRRPWLNARQTHFVECGPLVSFRRDAAQLLLPFEAADQLWGADLVWPAVMRRAGLRMGIIDALSVDHSLRPQAATYDKAEQWAAMQRALEQRSHLTMKEAFSVVRRYTIFSDIRP